ncbi:hypothetical protein [Enterococcus columbae]|uniref:Uncharacterized protein n=1 Tax=Enterococcus columbae DSM 7374 = ATCC 51263 TaxID=1121865 RepID=S1NS36_9ENTE|nr:hypothetical protein [Enterococcus columbae]EOT38042.1 hypothetical protein OMW_02299 [Enterococcus columbae DSM 7374 = ATCC 51263]EOW83709.1 hypothetical protein I568_01510 [Enterococcus columbae DSM 7374 = ATCC 51263]OJG20667.1 hypothetical protein RR47_GL001668 [Enterococcus columbae DSM 7374 = ATCC 51263]
MNELWQEVLTNWQNQSQTIQGKIYRLQALSATEFELSKSVLGPCGEKNYHPRIIVTLKDGQPIAESLLDLEVTPILRYDRTHHAETLDQAFQQLLLEFQAVVHD